jgi:heavy metal translocating P-type ATPase
VLSGSTLVGAAFDLIVSRKAADSTYARIVRLVERAQQSRAPMVRLADRYALGFLVLSVGLASIAWLVSGDAQRLLAVLVVATPCPLILAVPVAIIAGMSAAARHGALFKNAAAMETLALAKTVVLDKTGTVTKGQARVRTVTTIPEVDPDRLLALAASLDQASTHVVARALVAEAGRRGLPLLPPRQVTEEPGDGIEGQVGPNKVAVGGRAYVRARASLDDAVPLPSTAPGGLTVWVAIDGRFGGTIAMSDELRGDAQGVLAGLRSSGIERIVLASGDKREIAESIGRSLGVDEILAELSPAAKVEAVSAERRQGPVVMVGDGVNDAPALATADVGVAMGARGAAASSEAASVVILVDQLEPLVKAFHVARRTRRVALESVLIGLGLSIAGMLLASIGLIQPVPGALLQEVIDVAVILNALRALR